MKHLVALILIFVSSYVHADCQDTWLEYQSSTLYLSVDYSNGCYHGNLVINYAKLSRNGPQLGDEKLHTESLSFDSECQTKRKDRNGEVIEFSCRKNGVSPLAGTTYRYKQFKTTIQCDGVTEPDIERSFICIRGCGSNKPKKLHMPWGEGCA